MLERKGQTCAAVGSEEHAEGGAETAPNDFAQFKRTAFATEFPFVSVIVPVFNDNDRLQACLDALARQSYPAERFEVVVVDNGSNESVGPVIRRHRGMATLIEESNPGSYSARNRGIEQVRGEILAFTDSDCIPAADWIATGVAALKADPELAMVGGSIRMSPEDSTRLSALELHQLQLGFQQERYIKELHFSVTANLFTLRRVFDLVGMFNPRLRSFGDLEWGQRVHAAGLAQAYEESLLIDHPLRVSWRECVKKVRRITGGRFQLARERRQSRWAPLKWGLTAPWRCWKRCRSSGSLSARQTLAVLGVDLLFTAVRLCELLRLYLGGAPRR